MSSTSRLRSCSCFFRGLQICIVFSVIIILIISLERSFAVFKPFKYQALVSTKRILQVLLTLWSVWFQYYFGRKKTSVCITPVNVFLPAQVGGFFALFVLVGFLYLKMCNVVKRHRNAIAALQTDPQVTRRILKQRKSLKTTIHVIGAFIVCHMPLVLSLTLVWLGAISMGRKSFLLLSWTGLMALFNSCLDPFIYSWRENRIRRGIIHLLRHFSSRAFCTAQEYRDVSSWSTRNSGLRLPNAEEKVAPEQ